MTVEYRKREHRFEMVPANSPENIARITSYGFSESELTEDTVMVFNLSTNYPEMLSTTDGVEQVFEPVDPGEGSYTDTDHE